jgi:hypothetical protein
VREEVIVDEAKLRRVIELLPQARVGLGKHLGDYRRIAEQLEELDRAAASGGPVDEAAIRKAAAAFGASPMLLASTRAFRADDDLDQPDELALRELGQLVVDLVDEPS